MLTWLFIAAIAFGVVVAVAVTSCEMPLQDQPAGDSPEPQSRE